MNNDYLPTHDHFYGFVAEYDIENFTGILNNIEREELSDYIRNVLGKRNFKNIHDISYQDFRVEVGNKSTGVWDIVYKGIVNKNKGSKVYVSLCIEYKTSIEESNVNELIRQIKQRDDPAYIHQRPGSNNSVATPVWKPIKFLVTFDKRFEKYRKLIENENIKLVIMSSGHLDNIEKEYCKEKKSEKNLGDFSNA